LFARERLRHIVTRLQLTFHLQKSKHIDKQAKQQQQQQTTTQTVAKSALPGQKARNMRRDKANIARNSAVAASGSLNARSWSSTVAYSGMLRCNSVICVGVNDSLAYMQTWGEHTYIHTSIYTYNNNNNNNNNTPAND
jgi:LDH2 family malate/lactate/ureidoglycolate dehydrogenase